MSVFSVGDVVQLKSGGPVMTVSVVLGAPDCPRGLVMVASQQGYKDGDVSCIWFDGTEKKTSLFQSATLKNA